MIYISIVVITLSLFIVFILVNNHNKKNESNVVSINVNVPKFMEGFTTDYSSYDQNGKLIGTGTLPNGRVSPIKGMTTTGYVQINIKQVSTGKIVSTYNFNNNYTGVISTGVNLILDQDNTLVLPSTIVTIINNISTKITIN
jgi:hypothetical protein